MGSGGEVLAVAVSQGSEIVSGKPQSDAISDKKPRLVATGFLVEIGDSLADFEPAPNDAS
jgi:hypothetical protein